jgi:predicted glutamine amidotransferase
MCRLFGLLGNSATPAEPWLAGTECSLLKQSYTSEERAQRDGWGIAWFDGGPEPRIELGTGGPFEEAEKPRYLRAARAAHGPTVIAHIRHASNPMDLPRERLIALENSQPFHYRSYVFAHNGDVALPRETRPRLGPYEASVRGVNDSEILFWLMVRYLGELGEPLAAYARARDTILDVWRATGRRVERAFSGLNVLFTRGPNEIWAFCTYDGEHGTGLCSPTQPYYEMGYTADAKQLIVGSEPFFPRAADWRPLRNGEYLHGRVEHGLVAVATGPIPKPALAV